MKIAIIGSGISGLTSGYLLSRKNNVTVFEKNSTVGGRAGQLKKEGLTINPIDPEIYTRIKKYNK